MNGHEHVSELLAPYALDALDETDAAIVRRHIAHCALCQAELAGFSEVAGRLASLSPVQQPPPRLRRRVLAAVEREARSQLTPAPSCLSLVRLPRLGVLLALVVLLLQGWLLAEFAAQRALLQQQQQIQTILLSSDEAPIELQSPDPASPAHGYYRAEDALDQGLLNYYHLPAPGTKQAYHCWFEFATGAAVACGRLPLEPAGHGLLLLTVPERQPQRIRVTLESGSATTPAGPTILIADLAGA
jgi:hypothetical protein